MGSASSKSRKPKQQHLPKVGTAPNQAYEAEARQDATWQLSKWPMIILGLVILALVVVGALVLF
jgi:hypothetical protein